jgi:hypothetical protein
MTEVILTAALFALALILLARAFMNAWPLVVVEAPRHPCGFMPPS